MKAARSILSVPASNEKMVEKGLSSAADTVFLDLEDAVAPDAKPDARRTVIQSLQNFDWHGRPKLYRANTLDTPFFYRDLIEIVEAAGDELDAIMLPKVTRPEDLYAAGTLLFQLEAATGLPPGKIKLEAQIENAAGLANIDGIASGSDRLTALHFGPGDFAASLNMPQTSIGTMDEWDAVYPGHRFHYAMHRIVVAARAAGLRAIDGPVADYRDEKGLRNSCLLARSLGYDGKWCIHPSQIETVNEVFSPTERELEWARKVVAAYEEASAGGAGSLSLDGQMVDAASIRVARNILGSGASRGD